MTDLVEFIKARLDDDERAATAATPGPWRYDPGKQWFSIENKMLRDAAARAGVQGEEFVGAGLPDATIGVAATGPADHPQSMADAAFIARHDPARVLREVEARRRLVEQCVITGPDLSFIGSEFHPGDDTELSAFTLALLALPYVDHPDYDATWSPS